MDRLEFYTEMYYKELERKELINNRVRWLLSTWILILGAIFYCLKNYYKVSNDFLIYFNFSISFSIIFTCTAAVLVGASLSQKAYAYLPPPTKLEVYYRELRNDTGNQNNVDETFEDDMIEWLNSCTSQNFSQNNRQITRLVDSTHLMIASVILLFVSFLFIIPGFIEKIEPVQKIEIIDTKEVLK